MAKPTERKTTFTYGDMKSGISLAESKPIAESQHLDLAVWAKNDTVLLRIRGVFMLFTKEEFIDAVNTLRESAAKLKV
jgi:hypothetical protein